MNNEIRNELLTILAIGKNKDVDYNIKNLLECFEYDLKDKLKEIKYQEEQVKENLELLKFVREELNKEK